MSKEKKLGGRLEAFVEKIAAPLVKLASYPVMRAIQGGLVQTMPIIVVGSIFLVLSVLGSSNVGNGTTLLPFLSPIASKLSVMNSYTIGFLGLYSSAAIAMNYGEILGVDVKTSGILGLTSFIIINLAKEINTTAFSAQGLIVAIITSVVSIRIYKFFKDRNIVIKMPDAVPPNISNAFTSLIPFLAVYTICWFIRVAMDFDLSNWIMGLLTPLFSAAENIFVFTFKQTIQNLLWSVGLHGDNMVDSIFIPLRQIWTAENAAAAAAGVEGTALPHVWTSNGIERLVTWPAAIWPLLLYMITSKVKYLRTLGWACLPSAIFTIVEPVIYGLPLALNPYLMLPFLVITIITSFVSYGIFELGLVGRFFASMPWATPPFLLGPLGTGDWKSVLVMLLVFVIGLVIYYPFFKNFEKSLLAKEAENEAAVED